MIANAPPALPAVGTDSLVNPSSLALDTAADMPLDLKDALGLTPSSLIYKLLLPMEAASWFVLSIGVIPSPKVTMFSSLRTGNISR